MAKQRTKQLALFAEGSPPATDARACEAERKKKRSDASRKAFFARRASADGVASRSKAQAGEARPLKRAERREVVLSLLCADNVEAWDVAKRAGVSERFVKELLADAHDMKARVRSAIAILRAIETLPASPLPPVDAPRRFRAPPPGPRSR